MKFGDLLKRVDQEIQWNIQEAVIRHGSETESLAIFAAGMIDQIVSCYLRDDKEAEMINISFDLIALAQQAAKSTTIRDPYLASANVIKEAFDAGIFSNSLARHGNAASLLHQAETELDRREFVDFEYAGYGGSSLVLKGIKKDGSTRALRLSTGYGSRPTSIAVLETEDSLQLPRYQNIEVMEFAEEIGPKVNDTINPALLNLWMQRVVYLRSLLHFEGKFAWVDSKLENMGLFRGGKPYICDPDLGDPLEDEIHDAKYNAVLIKDMMNKGWVSFSPNAQGVFVTEYFTGLCTSDRGQVNRIRGLVKANNWHTLRIPSKIGAVSLIVDPSRENTGLEVCKAVCDHLRIARPSTSLIVQP